MMNRKIFGVGPNKTGTVSIASALRVLGFDVVHDYFGNNRRLNGMTFDGHEAYFDGDLGINVKAIFREYPGAKFILTTRDRESWIRSRLTHVLHDHTVGGPWSDFNRADWEREFDAIHEQVKATIPRDQLLTFNVSAGDGWHDLCRFVGVEVPSCPFPKLNTGRQKIEEIDRHRSTGSSPDLARISRHVKDTPWMTLKDACLMWEIAMQSKPMSGGIHMLEIGTFHGAGSAYLGEMARVCGGHLCTVDIPQNQERNPEELIRDCGVAECVKVSTRSNGAMEFLRSHLESYRKPFDLIYVDGNHEWSIVSGNILMSYAALRSGGAMVIDDIHNVDYPGPGVAWRQLVSSLPGNMREVGPNWGVLVKA